MPQCDPGSGYEQNQHLKLCPRLPRDRQRLPAKQSGEKIKVSHVRRDLSLTRPPWGGWWCCVDRRDPVPCHLQEGAADAGGQHGQLWGPRVRGQCWRGLGPRSPSGAAQGPWGVGAFLGPWLVWVREEGSGRERPEHEQVFSRKSLQQRKSLLRSDHMYALLSDGTACVSTLKAHARGIKYFPHSLAYR